MIEIPESATLAKQFNDTIAGKTITQVIAGQSPHKFAFFTGDPLEYPKQLTGRKVLNAEAVAGLVQVNMEQLVLVFNDGTNLRYWRQGEKLPPKHQLLLQFDDGTVLTSSVQMYGGMLIYENGISDNPYYLAARQKPSPLTEAFDAPYFRSIFHGAKPNLSVKALLATEQRIPGLGNGVLQDILFHAKLNPKTKINSLTEDEISALYTSLKLKVKEMAEGGGRDTEKDLWGNPGGYRTILSKNTVKSPCPICGQAIVKTAYLGGNVYFCPICQPMRK